MSKKPSLAESMRSAVQVDELASRASAQVELAKVAIPAAQAAAATRVGKKKVTAQLTPEDHKRLRRLALDRDATTEGLLSEAINDLFAKYGLGGVGQGSGAR
jgi:hypothetical protein